MADKEKKIYSDDDDANFCLSQIASIRQENSTLNAGRGEALKYYRGDPDIVTVIAKRSQVTTSDLFDTVEWLRPALLEVFTSGDEVVSLQPTSEEDTLPVENQQLLVNQQLQVKNNWFLILYDWFSDMLLLKTGAVKYQWFKQKKFIDKDYEDLTDDEYLAKIGEKDIEVLEHTLVEKPGDLKDALGNAVMTTSHNLSIRYTIEDEYPLIEAVPADEIGFSPRAREIDDTFVYHRISKEEWQFKKEYGAAKFKDCEGLKDDAENDTLTTERFADLGGSEFIWNEKKGALVVYECYYRDKKTGEPMLVELCGDKKLKKGKNKYGRPPFRVITPIKMAHRVSGFSIYDLVKEFQKIRTSMLRQIFDNLYFANNRRYFLDPQKVNINDYLNNNFPGAAIRTTGPPGNNVMAEEKAQLPQEVFTFWEMMMTEKDYHSGVPRSFQGVNPNVLNKTFRGQAQQVNQASQRIQLMCRLIAELGISPLISDVVDLNLRFLKKKTQVRYLNKWIELRPDNLVGRYDAIVNIQIGTGGKGEIIQYVQQLLGIFAQTAKMGLSIVQPDNVYHALKKLVSAMGFRDGGNWLTDPKTGDMTFALIMILIQKGADQDPQVGPVLMQLIQKLGLGEKIAGILNKQRAQIQGQAPGQPGAFPGADVSQNPVPQPPQPVQPGQAIQPTLASQGSGFFG